MANESVMFAFQDKNLNYNSIDSCTRTLMKAFNINPTIVRLEDLLEKLAQTMGKMEFGKMDKTKLLLENEFANKTSLGCQFHYEVDTPLFCSLVR